MCGTEKPNYWKLVSTIYTFLRENEMKMTGGLALQLVDVFATICFVLFCFIFVFDFGFVLFSSCSCSFKYISNDSSP